MNAQVQFGVLRMHYNMLAGKSNYAKSVTHFLSYVSDDLFNSTRIISNMLSQLILHKKVIILHLMKLLKDLV
jgi:hypothetical protein